MSPVSCLSHGRAVHDLFKNILAECSTRRENVLAVVTDNGSNMVWTSNNYVVEAKVLSRFTNIMQKSFVSWKSLDELDDQYPYYGRGSRSQHERSDGYQKKPPNLNCPIFNRMKSSQASSAIAMSSIFCRMW